MKLWFLLFAVLLVLPICAQCDEITGSISGKVIDEQGKPVAGVTVLASVPGSYGCWFGIHGGKAKTLGDGSYVIDGIYGPFRDIMLASDGTLVSDGLQKVAVIPGRVTHAPDLVAVKGVRLSGRIIDSLSGNPISNVDVYAEKSGVWLLHSKTDYDGIYTFLLVPGKVTVKCSPALTHYPYESASSFR